MKLLVADDDSFFAVEKLIEHLLVPSMPSLVVEPFELQNNLRARLDNYDADISQKAYKQKAIKCYPIIETCLIICHPAGL